MNFKQTTSCGLPRLLRCMRTVDTDGCMHHEGT